MYRGHLEIIEFYFDASYVLVDQLIVFVIFIAKVVKFAIV